MVCGPAPPPAAAALAPAAVDLGLAPPAAAAELPPAPAPAPAGFCTAEGAGGARIRSWVSLQASPARQRRLPLQSNHGPSWRACACSLRSAQSRRPRRRCRRCQSRRHRLPRRRRPSRPPRRCSGGWGTERRRHEMGDVERGALAARRSRRRPAARMRGRTLTAPPRRRRPCAPGARPGWPSWAGGGCWRARARGARQGVRAGSRRTETAGRCSAGGCDVVIAHKLRARVCADNDRRGREVDPTVGGTALPHNSGRCSHSTTFSASPVMRVGVRHHITSTTAQRRPTD